MRSIAKILFPVNVPEPFDYVVPQGMRVARGDFVFAPIGKQMKLGVVWELGTAESESIPGRKLKEIAERKNCRGLNVGMLKFVDWTAKYNCASLGMVLRMVLRSYKALDPSPIVTLYQPSTTVRLAGLSPARKRVLDLEGVWPARAADIAKLASVSASVVKTMAGVSGLLEQITAPLDPPFDVPNPDYDERKFALTPKQIAAGKVLSDLVAEQSFNIALLDGVTGSGKTEVYLEAAAQALRQGGQVLILVPEIALTQAGLRRFTERFDAEPAQWHSAMGEAARRRTWREVAQGRAKLVVGARSALYLPYADLQLIVVDEEHDNSYKQDEGVIYNARDMSVVKAKLSGASIVLASATPSLESLTNARTGRYVHVILPERPGSAVMPEIELVDLKEDPLPSGKFLSQPLVDGVKAALDQGDQAMLYLNRRGYAPLIICRACGGKLKSPDTDSWLVEHRRTGRAMCHHTGFSMPMPRACPECKVEDSLHAVGPGVERVAEEAAILFPDARIEVLSSDTAGNPERIRARMEAMAAGDIDIMVGTQMVVKGHNFPHLTFVGVVDGDLGLAGGDLRAGERTYQTLVQVAGRAGRAEKPGRALIQTHMPEHEALEALADGDREGFIAAELAMRELLGLPPYGKLAAVIISAPDANKADEFARKFLAKAPRAEGIEIMGPSEAPIAILRGRHRRRLLIKAEPSVNLSAYMNSWKSRLRPPNKTKLQIDIDPQGFM
ncbi:MAG: primosomal protein N' [Robiginitomaculum sp.]|nr:MAG: primosomal protein N' [Robiginitomaculum sp.]